MSILVELVAAFALTVPIALVKVTAILASFSKAAAISAKVSKVVGAAPITEVKLACTVFIRPVTVV